MDFALELLKGIGRLFLHPLTYLFLLVSFFVGLSRVRKLYSERNWSAISALVPAGTLAYLQRHAARHTETI